MEEKLLPCPFCGSKEVHSYWTPSEDIESSIKFLGAGCKRCSGMVETCFLSEDLAIKQWNRRIYIQRTNKEST